MPTVTLKVSAGDRELWVHAAEGEGVTLSEWLRRAAAQRLVSVSRAPGPEVVITAETAAEYVQALAEQEAITLETAKAGLEGVATLVAARTPQQGGKELEEAWEPIPAEVLEEIRAEWDAGGDLAQDDEEARLRSGETGIATPTGRGRDKPVSPELSRDYITSEPVTIKLSKESLTDEVGVEEVGEATPPTTEGLVTPNNESSASTPSEAEAGEADSAVSPTDDDARASSDPVPSEPSAPASAKEALQEQARQLLGEKKEFKPDFKPEKKAKKRYR